ncbi:MAG: hypothetical protein EZS26_001040 [Candidatus Ordinivivax streblomastigis]|uniref:RloB domain-containing protein n=1 Tax=Candidatus Ordinivivax streblomastigis TaxID=2540710 RepID=A0A5M8P3P1_9BACT|nr:MAG: hypothetical protein EZS26_001040 [Candidatus Ordinivivax streblomastigis]
MARKIKLQTQIRSQERETRPVRIRKYKMYILIVCEDTKTEPAYFESFKKLFPKETVFLRSIGTGKDPLGVVEQTVKERETLKENMLKEIDQVWSVFDIDDANENETKRSKFQDALTKAKTENIRLAYSNEVFELWLLLHLTGVSSENPISRQAIYVELQSQIRKHKEYENYEYDHHRIDPLFLSIIEEKGDEKRAITRAKQLEEVHQGKEPLLANPSTKVHLLVQELRDWIDYYNY